MGAFTVRDYRAEDAAAILEINAANVPEVGDMDASKLGAFAVGAAWLPVVEVDGEVAAFAVFLTQGADYESPNYRWFSERHASFFYVDRIAVDATCRGVGIGQALYREAISRARAGAHPVFCAEVNTVPANEASLRFHALLGFSEVARKRPYDPESEVAMLERLIDAG
jgi:predicted GNAT superfamily acetyltransferase